MNCWLGVLSDVPESADRYKFSEAYGDVKVNVFWEQYIFKNNLRFSFKISRNFMNDDSVHPNQRVDYVKSYEKIEDCF